MTGEKNSIRIYPHGSGYVTDQKAVQKLKDLTPKSFPIVKYLLTLTAKYVKRKGLFSTDSSRLKKVQMQTYELYRALKNDRFLEDEKIKKGEAWVIIEYLSLVSDAYPNWQEEYEALNHLIPQFF